MNVKNEPKPVLIEDIRVEVTETQLRERLEDDTVERYVEALEGGDRFPAVDLVPDGDGKELSSNVVDGGPLGGVLDVGLAVDEADAADHVAEAGRAVQPAPAALGTQAEPEDHSQRRPT